MARAFSRSCESQSPTTPSSSTYPPPPPPAIPGPESSCQELEPSSCDSRSSNAKNLAWSTPSNGIAEVEPFMGADSWPALSGSARSSSDSSKALSELSASVSQENLIAPNISTNPTNPNLNLNHALSDSEKPMAQGGSDASWTASAVLNSPPRHLSHNRNSGESGSKEPSTPQFHNRASHSRNSFRRGNGGGPRPRGGGGAYHNGYVNRRDHSRPNNEGNRQRDFGSRGAHMQQQRFMPRNFQRPPSYVGPSQPIGPLGYPEMYSPPFWVLPPPPEALVGGMQYFAHAVPPMVYYPQQDPQLVSMLVKQIDYYFSSENLCKDTYLRQNMDQHGWVPVSLIAGFNRVKQLTKDVQSIITAVQISTVVEVQGDKIRKRNDWMNWLLPPSNHSSIMSRPQSSGTLNLDMLAACMESVGLEGSTSDSSSRRGLVETNVDRHLGNQSVNKIDP